MNYAELPTSGRMLDDLVAVFGSVAVLQSEISDVIVAHPSKWRMEAVAELWSKHCAKQ